MQSKTAYSKPNVVHFKISAPGCSFYMFYMNFHCASVLHQYTMGRGVVHACHAGGLLHLLEGWTHHEVGAIDVDQIDVVWEAALKHGFKPLYNSR